MVLRFFYNTLCLLIYFIFWIQRHQLNILFVFIDQNSFSLRLCRLRRTIFWRTSQTKKMSKTAFLKTKLSRFLIKTLEIFFNRFNRFQIRSKIKKIRIIRTNFII